MLKESPMRIVGHIDAPKHRRNGDIGDTKLTLGTCPKCRGAVLDYGSPLLDSPLCVNCGWREPDLPQVILTHLRSGLNGASARGPYALRRDGAARGRRNGEAG